MEVWAVIGANYGDEGKGELTNFLSHSDSIVIRANGGSQAAHTVIHNGHRHVFSNFGSGTLKGAKTHLSKFMLINPIFGLDEYEKLKEFSPVVSCDPNSKLILPFDMFLNQNFENYRQQKHGSCGHGIGECEERSIVNPVYIKDSFDIDQLIKLRDEWVDYRIKHMNIPLLEEYKKLIYNNDILEVYLNDLTKYKNIVSIVDDSMATHLANSVVFENAQGLGLDQDMGHFPYVTRSNTGSKNIISLMNEMKITRINPVYVTRCYLTRHGAGPLENECDIGGYVNVFDETNVPNKWQDSIRYGFLDSNLLKNRIDADYNLFGDLANNNTLAITCTDQIINDKIIIDGVEINKSFIKQIFDYNIIEKTL